MPTDLERRRAIDTAASPRSSLNPPATTSVSHCGSIGSRNAPSAPDFTGAAPAAEGERLYQHVLRAAGSRHPVVESGRFGADMQVHLVNDGPVTIPLVLRR